MQHQSITKALDNHISKIECKLYIQCSPGKMNTPDNFEEALSFAENARVDSHLDRIIVEHSTHPYLLIYWMSTKCKVFQ